MRASALFLILTILLTGQHLCISNANAGGFTITETTAMNFGTLQIPSSGSDYVELRDGSDQFTNQSTGTLISGNVSRGKYRVKLTGTEDSATITIDIIATSTGHPEITVTNIKGKFAGSKIASFPAGGIATPPTRGKNLIISPRLDYTSNVASGTFSPTFDIIILFE